MQQSIQEIKRNRVMGERYMLFEDLLKDEYSEGKKDGLEQGRLEGKAEGLMQSILTVLSLRGTVTPELQSRLETITDEVRLNELLSLAVKAEGVEEFEKELERILTPTS